MVRGIGSKMMKSTISEARLRGYKFISLTTDKENAVAIHLFEKYNFQHFGESTPKKWDHRMVLYLSWRGKILFHAYMLLALLARYSPRWVKFIFKLIKSAIKRAQT